MPCENWNKSCSHGSKFCGIQIWFSNLLRSNIKMFLYFKGQWLDYKKLCCQKAFQYSDMSGKCKSVIIFHHSYTHISSSDWRSGTQACGIITGKRALFTWRSCLLQHSTHSCWGTQSSTERDMEGTTQISMTCPSIFNLSAPTINTSKFS